MEYDNELESDEEDYDNGPNNALNHFDDPSCDWDMDDQIHCESNQLTIETPETINVTICVIPNSAPQILESIKAEHEYTDRDIQWESKGEFSVISAFQMYSEAPELESLLKSAGIPFIRIGNVEQYKNNPTKTDDSSIESVTQYRMYQPKSTKLDIEFLDHQETLKTNIFPESDIHITLKHLKKEIDFQLWDDHINWKSIPVFLALQGIR